MREISTIEQRGEDWTEQKLLGDGSLALHLRRRSEKCKHWSLSLASESTLVGRWIFSCPPSVDRMKGPKGRSCGVYVFCLEDMTGIVRVTGEIITSGANGHVLGSSLQCSLRYKDLPSDKRRESQCQERFRLGVC